ncbi:MAG: hypothetical protein EHM89_00225 [Acidobacteria bacterium]|nr:MAG: hypothetical protein EHM89_00225 [Acidobacteriota bacterium]
MSLDVHIKVDPGDSLAKITAVERGLKQVESWGKSTERSTTGLAGAFGKLSEALKREHDMLDRIHGPSRRYTQDLQTLDALLHKNVISTQHYAEQVKRLNQEIAATPEPRSMPSGGGGASAAMDLAGAMPGGGVIGAFVGGGLVGGAVAALGELGSAIGSVSEALTAHREKVIAVKDNYIELSNAARKFTDGGYDTNQILGEQQALAHDLHSNLGETIGLYDAVRDGVDEMNLSHEEQLRLTKTLGEGFILANKSIGEASGVMTKFSYAMASGSISALEMETIMKQAPEIANLWTSSLGMTRNELTKLASEGKLPIETLVRVLIDGGGKMDEQMKRNQRTTAGWREEYKAAFELAKGEGKNSMDATREAIARTADASIDLETRTRMAFSVLEGGEAALRPYVGQMVMLAESSDFYKASIVDLPTFNQALTRTAEGFARISESARNALQGSIVAGATAATKAMGQLSGAVVGIAEAFASDGFFALAKAVDPWFVAPESPKKAEAVKQKLIDINQVVRDGAAAWDAQFKAQQRALHEFDDAAGLAQQTENEKGISERIGVLDEADIMVQNQVNEILNKNREDIEKNDAQIVKSAQEAADKTAEAWGSALGGIGKSFLDAALEGEQSFGQMAERMMVDISMLIIKMAALEAIKSGVASGSIGSGTGGFLSAIFGGANGFDYVANSNRLQLPGFATGGSFTVGGAGGTDSKLAMFRVTPGESVHVRTPQQQQAMAQQGPSRGPTQVLVQMQNDRRDLVQGMNSRDGERVLVNLDRKLRRARR